jgi:large conductance mechanosensitive channel
MGKTPVREGRGGTLGQGWRPSLDRGRQPMLKGFYAFIMRGNVVDLAVAVVIGAAFGTVVTALVKDLITPLIAAIFGKPNFAYLGFTIHHSHFPIGDLVNAIVSFLLVAAAVYFMIVAPMNAVTTRFKKPDDAPPALRECPECLSDIPAAAHRCKYCTTQFA